LILSYKTISITRLVFKETIRNKKIKYKLKEVEKIKPQILTKYTDILILEKKEKRNEGAHFNKKGNEVKI